jgi:secretion/DNA translocation related CpaE-like protein
MTRPVACVHEDALLDEVLRAAAAAGCTLERVADVADLRARWHEAPMIVLDESAAAACLAFAMPRRESTVLVCSGPPPPEVLVDAVTLGVVRVVTLPADESWLVDAFADAIEKPAAKAGSAVAIVGGRGGAGASVFAAAIGLTALDMGRDTLLVDCDPLGGGLDLVIGAERSPGMRWPDLRLKSGRIGVSSLRSALPGRDKGGARLTLLSGARSGDGPTAEAVAAVVDAGKRGGETVVCDLPRSPDAAVDAALDRAELAVVVVPAEVRACASARRIACRISERGIRAVAVVRGPAAMRLRASEVAEAVGVPLLATIHPDRGMSYSLDHGEFRPRGSLARAARQVLTALDTENPRTARSLSPQGMR